MRTLSGARASYFVSSAGQPRVRRPRDVATAVLGLLLMLWAILAIDSVPQWEQSLVALIETAPTWVYGLLRIGYLLSLIYAAVVFVGLIAGRKSLGGALRDFLLVGLVATGVTILLSLVINDAWPYVLPEIDLTDPTPRYPVLRVALVTAILVVVAPHLTRPLRRFGWVAIFVTALASIGLGYASPLHALGSFGIGLFSAGIYLIIVGSPRGYPDPDVVSAALDVLGVTNTGIEAAPNQTWGVVRFVAKDHEGKPVDIKVYGRDAFDSQLAAKIWHTMWYRDMGRTVSYSRLQAVEHEALVSVMADRAGVGVPRMRTVGSASAEISLVAFEGSGVLLSDMKGDEIDDDLLARVWRHVATMHDRSISHGALSTSVVRVDGGEPEITDFALGSLAPDDSDLGSDVVGLLYSLAVLVGEERAVTSAIEGLGRERLVAALPYLQVPAVSPTTRRLADKPKQLVKRLGELIVEEADAELPEPVKLRRVTTRNLVMLALIILVGSALIPLFTEVDYAEIWDVLQSANWALMVVALIVGHTQFFPQATATMFAVPAKLPFWPLLTLQTASQFISLAIPSSAGRVAMNAAFLHKFGVSVTVALAQGAIDGFSGFLVQIVILLVVLLTGNVDLGLDIDTSDVRWLLLLGILALLVLVVVVVVLRVDKLRDKVVPVVKQAWGALMVVLREPTRAIGLLGSNFVYWNVLGITLWLLLEAVGAPVSYGSALFVAAGTSLFAGFMPVPGGVGVAEAAMVALLATFGVDQSVALAVTAAYRAITFYMPALEGFFGSRWLERHDYI